MQMNIPTFNSFQTLANSASDGTRSAGNAIFNSGSGTLPFLFTEFQKFKYVSDKCSTIIDSIRSENGTAELVSAVFDAKRKYDDDLSDIKLKISKAAADGLDHGDRRVFLSLDKKAQAELIPMVAGDDALCNIIAERNNEATR
jgi:hypothetical protein